MDGEAVAKYANYVRQNHMLEAERHEAACKLREIPVVIIEGDTVFRYSSFFHELANAIGISEHITFATVRDRLIHLIGGDKEADDGLADSVRDSGVCVGVCVDGGKGEVTEPDAIAEYHRTLRRMLGEVKGVHDKLVAQAEPYARLKHEYARLKHECHMYRAMLNDAAKEFQDLMEEHKCCRNERDAYKQNYHDVIHGNEINAEWFDKRGFIELPKGKDGKHIHIGDTVRWGDRGEPFKVQTIEYYPRDVSISDAEEGIYVSACHCNHVDDEPDPATSAFDKYDAGLLTRDELVAALREAS